MSHNGSRAMKAASVSMQINPRSGEPETLVSLQDIQHRYGNTIALKSCRLDIRPGEIHGLVGENGSGKSTVVKILSGIIEPTKGKTLVGGTAVRLTSPSVAQSHGIMTVFQETLIAEGNTAAENIFLGTDGVFRRNQRNNDELIQAGKVLEDLGVSPRILSQPVHALSIAHRQVLTLVRALVRPWKMLILDEATSALDIGTRDKLFDLIKAKREEGRSVLFVSHRMDELEILIDRATVQRSGTTIAVLEKAEATPDHLVSLMSGQSERSADDLLAGHLVKRPSLETTTILRCEGVRLAGATAKFDLEVRGGEILGVAGLEGQGGTELVEAISGVRRPAEGKVRTVDDHAGQTFRNYREAFRAGVAYVPAKRQEEGLFAPMTVRDNLAIATIHQFSKLGFFRRKSVDAMVQQYMGLLAVWPNDIQYPISGLSGGNAQKVLIGRWLAAKPRVLVLNDPLRGVDVGTKRQFYKLLRELADKGVAIVILSTEIEELLLTSDRIVVCRRSTVNKVLSQEDQSYDAVLAAMFGVSDVSPAIGAEEK